MLEAHTFIVEYYKMIHFVRQTLRSNESAMLAVHKSVVIDLKDNTF